MAKDLAWLNHEVGSVKEVLAKLKVTEVSPMDAFVQELKKLPKRKTMIFHVTGEVEQKKTMARLNQLFMKRELTGQFSVRKDLEAGSVYVYKRRASKNGGSND